jgi:hypothetical protein
MSFSILGKALISFSAEEASVISYSAMSRILLV